MQLKKVLIISPHFPPVNAADMHRVRQSLPYFKEFGWNAEVITVYPKYIESYSIDKLLLKTIPKEIPIHYVKAWDVKKTRKFGLGSLSIRSFLFIKKKGDELLLQKKFDLVYFSTTAFHVMALGPRWKKKFGVPFILDMQDPWRSDFYLDKPKAARPPKFFVSYNIDKYLEAKTVPKADGIISVSQGYCNTFLHRYPTLNPKQFCVIPFGASTYDFEIMKQNITDVSTVKFEAGKINVVYIGRGGHDMRFALEIIFGAFKKGLEQDAQLFANIRFWFIGTSYAPPGSGVKTIKPLADELNIGKYVTEISDRLPYFETLFLLNKANVLLVPGSTDTNYTASKIFPYIMAEKPLLAVFHKLSSVIDILNRINFGKVVEFDHSFSFEKYIDECFEDFVDVLNENVNSQYNHNVFDEYSAKSQTCKQVIFFEITKNYFENIEQTQQ